MIRTKGQSPAVTTDTMSFGDALIKTLAGSKIRRKAWPNSDDWFVLHQGKLHIHRSDDKLLHPVIIDAGDIMGEDWVVIP